MWSTTFSWCTLKHALLLRSRIAGSRLVHVNLSHAQVRSCTIERTTIIMSSLAASLIDRSSLEVSMVHCDLTYSQWDGSDVLVAMAADLKGAEVHGDLESPIVILPSLNEPVLAYSPRARVADLEAEWRRITSE